MSDVAGVPLRSLSETVLDLVPAGGAAGEDAWGSALRPERIVVALPFELLVRAGAGEGVVRLEASAPRQRTETTHMPVYHHLRVRIDAAVTE